MCRYLLPKCDRLFKDDAGEKKCCLRPESAGGAKSETITFRVCHKCVFLVSTVGGNDTEVLANIFEE